MRRGLLSFLSSLVYADTRPSRIWVAITNVLMATYLFTAQSIDDMVLMHQAIPISPILVLQILLVLNAGAILSGLSGKYSFRTWVTEWWLAFLLWGTLAWTNTAAQAGIPGPSMGVFLMVIWLLGRHPNDD